MELHTKKTKELIIDFRKHSQSPQPLRINGETVEPVTTYRYLGVTLNNKKNWTDNVNELQKKRCRRLHLIRRLHNFHIDDTTVALPAAHI